MLAKKALLARLEGAVHALGAAEAAADEAAAAAGQAAAELDAQVQVSMLALPTYSPILAQLTVYKTWHN